MQTRTDAATHQSSANGESLWTSQGQAAASIGLEVWNKVEKTNPDETKSFNKGGFQGTAIAPIYQIKRATEVFGPFGLGWGVELISEAYVDGKPFVVDGQVVGKGVWGATEQKVHLSPAPARKPLWRLVSSGKPSFCRTIASPFVIGV
ncbi:hypothetical protein [Pseudomonas putida]|uniref:hypothetical protein n=1 Tax=Pseudomonas putida TaxID=303 RepID=UPI00035CA6E3|nr:hypothetical protein [Pseudomonas putida]